MSDRPSADIIAFPARRPAAPVAEMASPAHTADTQEDPAERLRLALISLDNALAAQRQAMAEWQGSLAALRGGMLSLNTSLRGYHETLGTLGEKVQTINAEARRMESWADDALKSQQGD
jgi:hypothetical protein